VSLVVLNILVVLLGLCLGSFINVVIYRLPRAEDGFSVSRPRRSICPNCQASIAWYDNLPLLSYAVLGGACRHCKTRISWRYPLVELMAGLLTLAVFHHTGLLTYYQAWMSPAVWVRTLAGLYFVLGLLAITFIDLDEMIIPDVITLPGMVLGLAAAALAPDPGLIGRLAGIKLFQMGVHDLRLLSIIGSVGGLILGGGLIWIIFQAYYLVRREEGIGGGDMTLLAMIGANLGWRSVLVTIFLGSVIAMLAAIGMAVRQGEFRLTMKLPFGPFLSLAALIFMFFGEALLRWYLG